MKRTAIICLCLSLIIGITGCWDSDDLDEVAMIFGLGLDKTEEGYELSVETLQSTGEISALEPEEESMVLAMEGDTPFEVVRSMIRQQKRYLTFTHSNIWVFSETLAEDDLITPLDILTRDETPRLNSLIFVTPEDPKDILKTDTITGELTSVEMAEVLAGTEFTGEFHPIDLKTFFEMINAPVQTAFIPMLQTTNQDEETITALNGTAVINENQVVGTLNTSETKGLLFLREEALGGSITTELPSGDHVSMEMHDQDVSIEPSLDREQLTVDVDLEVEGYLAEVPPDIMVNEETIRNIEENITEKLQTTIQMTLKKLQEELHTDIVDFGILTHQAYPQEWPVIQDDWEDIFSNADVNLHVETSIDHEGLLDQHEGEEKKKLESLPFFFWDHED